MFSPFPINKKILVHYGHAIEHVMVFLNLVQNIAHVTFHYCQFAVRDVIQVKHIAEVRSFWLLTCEIVFVKNDITHNLYPHSGLRLVLLSLPTGRLSTTYSTDREAYCRY